MGHHLLDADGKHKPVKDFDLLLVHHFLMLSAKELSLVNESQALLSWSWLGPGVWQGVNIEKLGSLGQLFETAEKIVAKYGAEIPESYLNEFLPKGIHAETNQDSNRVIGILRDIQSFIQKSA